MCLAFWAIGLSICIPTVVGWTYNLYDEKVLECFWSRTHNLSFTVFFTVGVVFFPIFVISFSFVRIFKHVRDSKRRIGTMKQNISSITAAKDSVNQRPATKGTTFRLATSLLIIFSVFVFCWAPYSLLIVIDHRDSLPMEVYLYALMLAHMHSTLNFIVYYFTNPHFRHGYCLVLEHISFGLIRMSQKEHFKQETSLTINKSPPS